MLKAIPLHSEDVEKELAAEKGVTPPGVDPEHQKIRSVAIVLPADVPYKEGAKEALVAKPGVAPATV